MFVELDLPSRAISFPKFYIASVDEVGGEFMFLRNDGKGIDNGDGDFDLYLFKTKAEAHIAAITYYNDNIMSYPYNDEYNTLQNLTSQEGSQVMEFI